MPEQDQKALELELQWTEFGPEGCELTVDRVELWVAYDQCSDCPNGVAWTQTEQTIDNIEAILTEAGSSLDRIVKTTVFLASLDDFQGMNEVYAGRIGDTPPARSTIEVGALPSGALVEIEAIAVA